MAEEDCSKTSYTASALDARLATPDLISPPITKTPPTVERQAAPAMAAQARNRSSTPVDPAELAERLQSHEEGSGRQREHTPGASPSRKRQRRVYGDRSVASHIMRDLHRGKPGVSNTDSLQLHPESVWPRSTCRLQLDARRRLSSNTGEN